jgi:hypothetical protein
MAAAWACSSAGGTKKPGSSSDGDADADADTDADADVDADTDTETEPVSEGEWCDEETELCWQNPAENVEMCWYHAAGEPHITLNPDGVIDYCGELVWAGHSDWRLPEIDELIGLIRGCWSASPCTGRDYFYIWTVYFAAAAVAEQRPDSEKMVRCVRDGSGGPD